MRQGLRLIISEGIWAQLPRPGPLLGLVRSASWPNVGS